MPDGDIVFNDEQYVVSGRKRQFLPFSPCAVLPGRRAAAQPQDGAGTKQAVFPNDFHFAPLQAPILGFLGIALPLSVESQR